MPGHTSSSASWLPRIWTVKQSLSSWQLLGAKNHASQVIPARTVTQLVHAVHAVYQAIVQFLRYFLAPIYELHEIRQVTIRAPVR